MNTLREVIALARERAPFYTGLYAGVRENASLADLPIIDSTAYWEAHRQDRANVLTRPLADGAVLNSGGTTGSPKFSYFTDAEWDDAVALSARAYMAAGLRDGDRVANLFAAGDLYSSFLFATESFKAAPARVLQFPIAYSMNFASVTMAVRDFGVNVLAGFPTHLLRAIDHLESELGGAFMLQRILFAGELFTEEQRAFLGNRFPGIAVRSVGYATIDAGLIGYADDSCEPSVHRVFDGSTIVEVVDEDSGEVIDRPGEPGSLVFTSCSRRLMPMLRYPTGDRGQWVDAAGTADRRFALLGRGEESVRVATYTLLMTRVREILAPFRESAALGPFQLLVTQENRKDRLTLRLVTANSSQETSAEILAAFRRALPELAETMDAGMMHPLAVELTDANELIVAPRTGKLRAIVDRRER